LELFLIIRISPDYEEGCQRSEDVIICFRTSNANSVISQYFQTVMKDSGYNHEDAEVANQQREEKPISDVHTYSHTPYPPRTYCK